MNIYKIYYHSACGTYFAAYLQSLTVVANTKEQAIVYAKQWMDDNGQHFINMDSSKWGIETLITGVPEGVIDFHLDSDY